MVLFRLSKYLATLGLLLWSGDALAVTYACGPDTPPPPAAERGLTCEVWYDNFTDIKTIDTDNTVRPGFQWYLHTNWPGLASGNPGWQLMTNATADDVRILPGGGLDLRMLTNRGGSNAGGDGVNMMTCASNGRPNQWVGATPFAPGVMGTTYVDVSLRSVTPGGWQKPVNNWWSVVWTFGVEFLAAPDPFPNFTHFSEIDFFEDMMTPPGAPFRRYVHSWHLNGGVANPLSDHYQYGMDQFPNIPRNYAVLIVPVRDNIPPGTGFIRGYVNEAVDPQNIDRTWTEGDDNLSVTETNHSCLMITTGYQQSTVLNWFRVWVRPPPPLTGIGRRR